MPRRAFSASPPKEAHLLRPTTSPTLLRRLPHAYFAASAEMQWRVHCRQAELLAEKGIQVTPEECMASFWQALVDFYDALHSPRRTRGVTREEVVQQSRLLLEAAAAKVAQRAACEKEQRSKKYILFLSRYYPLAYYIREHLGLTFRDISVLLSDYYGFTISLPTLRRYYKQALESFPNPPLPEGVSLPSEFTQEKK